VTGPQTPAPANPAAGAGPLTGLRGPTPADILARLHALVDEWEADMPGHAHYAVHWRDRKDGWREGAATGRLRQLNDCAVVLRNALNDLAKETT
jgi:hypothetical protein